MHFRNWWNDNHDLIVRASNFWFLPKKLKTILRMIVASIDAMMDDDKTAFTNTPAPQELA